MYCIIKTFDLLCIIKQILMQDFDIWMHKNCALFLHNHLQICKNRILCFSMSYQTKENVSWPKS